MNSSIRCCLTVGAFLLPCLGLSAQDITLVAGTLVQCTVNEPNFSSRTAQEGDPLVCYARPMHEFGCAAFPRGSQFAGQLVSYKNPGRFYGKGWMQLEFDRVILPDGQAPVTAKIVSVAGSRVDANGKILGKGHAKRDAAEWALPILVPYKLITLPRRGPYPTLKGERTITLRLLDDVQVPCGSDRADEPLGSGWRHFGPSGRKTSSGFFSYPRSSWDNSYTSSPR